METFIHKDVTEKIIRSFYKVYNNLGYGFLEKIYENALCYEIQKLGLGVNQQFAIQVQYENIILGDYCCDLLIDNKIIIEVKAVKTLRKEHEAQLLNYLKATEVGVGLLLNFGIRPEIKRRLSPND